MEKTLSKREALNKLFKENGLLAEDVHQHKHYTIIARTGIEKIQYKNNVEVKFIMVKCEKDFVVVKAIAQKESESKGLITIQTFGSASAETSQNKYYSEMAEKRALSRAILKITDFYQYGVYGEDEADEFKKVVDTSPIDIKPPVVSDPVIPEGVNNPMQLEPGSSPHQTKELRQLKAELLLLLNNEHILETEKSKMVSAINKLTEEDLRKKVASVRKVIEEREAKHQQISRPATVKQIELLNKMLSSHVVTEKEQSDYAKASAVLTFEQASELIEFWTQEIKARKSVESQQRKEVVNG